MLRDIYLEYSEEILDYLLGRIYKDMDGHELIDMLTRGYYTYIRENGEIFHFVDQFSSCPALASQCSEQKNINSLNILLEEMKNRRIIKNFRNDNLRAIIFYPIKSIAIKQCIGEFEQASLLDEMITIIQDALLL